jgi:TMEM175 potassium channel family protein
MPTKARMEALSDGIFSVAMTLLVLDIKMPDNLRLQGSADLWRHFASVGHAFVVYALSFVVLAMFWAGHNYQFHYVEKLDRQLLWTNFMFLLATTTIPFATNLITTHPDLTLAVCVYAANILVLDLGLLLHVRRLQGTAALASRDFTPAIGRRIQRRLLLMSLVPLLAIAVSQVSAAWGLRTFYILLALHFLPHRGSSEEA